MYARANNRIAAYFVDHPVLHTSRHRVVNPREYQVSLEFSPAAILTSMGWLEKKATFFQDFQAELSYARMDLFY